MQKISFGGVQIPIIIEADGGELVRARFVWRVAGSVADAVGGEARFAAELLGEGAAGDARFNDELENRAIELDFDAGFETFVAQITCLREHFGYALGRLAQVLGAVDYGEAAFARVAMRRCGEIATKALDFNRKSSLGLRELLYGGAMARDFDGTAAAVRGFTPGDIREVVARLDLANLYVVLSGGVGVGVGANSNLDGGAAENLAENPAENAAENLVQNPAQNVAQTSADCHEFADTFGITRVLEVLPAGTPRELAVFAASGAARREVAREQSSQAFITFGAPFGKAVGAGERHLCNIAFFVLGASGFGSRLMEEVRVRRGLAYSVGCGASLACSHQHFGGALQTKNKSADEAAELVAALVGEFAARGVSDKEVADARRCILGGEPLRNETCFARAAARESGFYAAGDERLAARVLAATAAADTAAVNEFIFSLADLTKLSFFVVRGE